MSIKGNGQRIAIITIIVVFVSSTLAFSGLVIWEVVTSGKDNQQSAQQAQDKQGENKLEGTKLENYQPVEQVKELKIIDLAEGNGETVKAGATVKAHYTGALAKDGTIFQSSLDLGEPVEFSLDGVIEGWQKGLPGMKVGGKRRLIIPAEQAYGEQGTAGIPPNSPLVFDIVLVAIN